MRYLSVDQLSDFEFHDAKFTFSAFHNNHLTVNAFYLNIHKDAAQNPFETDMEIANARITFQGFQLHSYEPGRSWKSDEKGNYYSEDPQVIFSYEVAHPLFLAQLKAGMTVLDLGIKEDKIYYIEAVAMDPFFTVFFTFDHVVIEWDDYKKEAWYTSRNS